MLLAEMAEVLGVDGAVAEEEERGGEADIRTRGWDANGAFERDG